MRERPGAHLESGFVNGDTSASLTTLPTISTTATQSSDVVAGGYPISFGGAVDPNYTITYVNSTLTVTPANQTISWSNPADIIVGTPLGSSQLNAALSVIGPAPAGALTYIPSTGTVLGLDTGQALVAIAAATNDYYSATAQVTINVHYGFQGFLPPLDPNSVFGVNRTVPIRYRLTDANGNYITDLSAVASVQGIATDSNGNPIAGASPFNLISADNKGVHHHDSDNDRDDHTYIFNWKTKGLAAGCYEILVTLADGTTQTKLVQLVFKKGDADLMGLNSGTDDSSGAGVLLAGNLNLFVDNFNGLLTADESARIDDAVAAVDAVVQPYGANITEVSDSSLTNVTLDSAGTTATGGLADGVLGCTTDAGEITLVNGWNFYAGSDATQIGSGQYDFQTVVTHELGHALGLGHSADSSSVMYATLNTGMVNRTLTSADLNVADSDTTGACGLHAASIALPIASNSPVTSAPDRDAFFALLTKLANAEAFALAPALQPRARDAVFASVEVDFGTAKPAALNTSPIFAAPLLLEPADDLFSDSVQEGTDGLPTPSTSPAEPCDSGFDFIPSGRALYAGG